LPHPIRPAAEQASDVLGDDARAAVDGDIVQQAALAAPETDVTEEGLGPQLDRAAVAGWAETPGPVMQPGAVEAGDDDVPARVGEHRDPLRAELPGGDDCSLVGVVDRLEEREVGARGGVGIMSQRGDTRRGPRLVAVAEHADRLHRVHGVHRGHRPDSHVGVGVVGDAPAHLGATLGPHIELDLHRAQGHRSRVGRTARDQRPVHDCLQAGEGDPHPREYRPWATDRPLDARQRARSAWW